MSSPELAPIKGQGYLITCAVVFVTLGLAIELGGSDNGDSDARTMVRPHNLAGDWEGVQQTSRETFRFKLTLFREEARGGVVGFLVFPDHEGCTYNLTYWSGDENGFLLAGRRLSDPGDVCNWTGGRWQVTPLGSNRVSLASYPSGSNRRFAVGVGTRVSTTPSERPPSRAAAESDGGRESFSGERSASERWSRRPSQPVNRDPGIEGVTADQSGSTNADRRRTPGTVAYHPSLQDAIEKLTGTRSVTAHGYEFTIRGCIRARSPHLVCRLNITSHLERSSIYRIKSCYRYRTAIRDPTTDERHCVLVRVNEGAWSGRGASAELEPGSSATLDFAVESFQSGTRAVDLDITAYKHVGIGLLADITIRDIEIVS